MICDCWVNFEKILENTEGLMELTKTTAERHHLKRHGHESQHSRKLNHMVAVASDCGSII